MYNPISKRLLQAITDVPTSVTEINSVTDEEIFNFTGHPADAGPHVFPSIGNIDELLDEEQKLSFFVHGYAHVMVNVLPQHLSEPAKCVLMPAPAYGYKLRISTLKWR